jgi:hypothetical protein
MKHLILKYSTLAGLLGAVAWFVSAPDWEPVIAIVGALAAFVTLSESFSRTPQVEGRWEYTVVTGDAEFSHKGDCYIKQEGEKLRIQGARRYSCALKARRKVCKSVNISWESDWAHLYDDNVLRFEYHIAIAEPRRGGAYIDAICRLNITSPKPSEMTGNYYMLPPFAEATLNCKWGTITFRRLEAGAELLPPIDYTPDDKQLEMQNA